LEIRDLTKAFGSDASRTVALNGVSLSVPKGGSIGVIGESGSGKTTLARVILGLETADSGSILFEGRPRVRPRTRTQRLEYARDVQIVFQDPSVSLDPRETLEQSLVRTLTLHFTLSREQKSERIRTLIDNVGLTERQARALPGELSGGQKQRVAIARALAISPKLLVLDEAVSALDVSVQAQILNLLNDLRRELSVTYVFVSHDLSVVRYVTESAIVMRRGIVMERGSTEELLAAPHAEYTRLLVASVPRPGWDPHDAAVLRRALNADDASTTPTEGAVH